MRASRGDGVERKAITDHAAIDRAGRGRKNCFLRWAKASVGPCGWPRDRLGKLFRSRLARVKCTVQQPAAFLSGTVPLTASHGTFL